MIFSTVWNKAALATFNFLSKYFCYVSLPSPPRPHPTKGEGEGLGLEDVIIAGSFDIDGYDCKLTQTLIQRGVCLQYVDDVMAPPPYPDKASVIGNLTQISLTALEKVSVIGNWVRSVRLH